MSESGTSITYLSDVFGVVNAVAKNFGHPRITIGRAITIEDVGTESKLIVSFTPEPTALTAAIESAIDS